MKIINEKNMVELTISSLGNLPQKPTTKQEYEKLYNPDNLIHTCMNKSDAFFSSRSGTTVIPAIFTNNKKSEEHFKYLTCFYIDFDKGNTLDEVIDICEKYGILPYAYYETFGCSDEMFKFRLIFHIDEPIYSLPLCRLYFSIFKYLFKGMLDNGAANPFHGFLGGKGKGKRLNPTNIVTFHEMISALTSAIKFKSPTHYPRNLKTFIQNYVNDLNIGDKIEPDLLYHMIDSDNSYSKLNNFKQKLNKSTAQNGLKMAGNNANHIFNNIWNSLNPAISGSVHKYELFLSTLLRDWGNNCKLFPEITSGKVHMDHFMRSAFIHPLFNLEDGGNALAKSLIEYFYKNNLISSDNAKIHNNSKNKKYTPGCSSFTCPYINECSKRGKTPYGVIPAFNNIYVNTDEVIKTQPIEVSSMNFGKDFKRVLNDPTINFVILNYETSIGKTEELMKLFTGEIKIESGENFTLSLPRYNLMTEVVDRIEQKLMNEDLYFSIKDYIAKPELPILNDIEINKLINIDRMNGGNGLNILKEYLDSKLIKDKYYSKTEEYTKITKYLRLKKEFKLKNNKITTHADIFINNDDSNKILIFDEDPKDSLFQTAIIKISTIKYIKSFAEMNDANKDIIDFLDQIINIENKKLTDLNTFNKPNENDWKEFIFFAKREEKLTEENIYSILSWNTIKRNDDVITIGKINKFPKNKKIIILSATASEFIYKNIEPNLKFITTDPVEPNGKIILNKRNSYSDHSFKIKTGYMLKQSEIQQCLDNNIKLEDYKKTKLNNFIEEMKEDLISKNVYGVITHKKYVDLFKGMGFETMHFGNLDGLNNFKNKNIAIIGTPYRHRDEIEFIYYCLFNKLPEDMSVGKHDVTYNGFTFPMKTHNDESLRNIDMALLNTHMTQAVGRARLIRADSDCTVYLYGKFPVRFANII